jgi:hypothetical protein
VNPGRVLHTGALLALADGSLYMGALLRWAVEEDVTLAVPTVAIAQAWARAGSDRYRIGDLLTLDVVVPVPLSQPAAIAVGELIAKASGTDVVDGHTVHLALDQHWVVVTDEAAPLRELNADILIDEVPPS